MPELKPVYLLVGGDRPKITRALGRLRARAGEGAVERISARENSGEDVVASCNALALLAVASGRLFVVDDVERWKSADVKALEAYLHNPAPNTVVALTGDVKPDSPIAKAVRAHGDVLVYDVAKRNLPAWLGEQFSRLGTRADRDACRALLERVGDDVEELATEVDKLATWAGAAAVTVADVEELVVGRADAPVFALTDAWGRRDVASALAACETLLERSDRPRRDEVTRVAALLASHVARVRKCRHLIATGTAARDAAATLKLHPFAAEKAFAHAANFSEDELRQAVITLADLDGALKGGSRLPGDLELERALVEVTTAAVPGRSD